MVSAITSATPTQPVVQSTAAATQNTAQSKPQSSDSGGDSVHLSKAAQEKTGCSGH
jgi:hypothetical protein